MDDDRLARLAKEFSPAIATTSAIGSAR